MKYIKTVKDVGAITVGSAMIAAAVYFFMMPSNLSIGSIAALAMVISNFIPVPVSVLTLILNLALLGIGFLLIGPEFGAKTAYTTVIMPVFMGAYELVFPDFQSVTQDPLLDAICCILILGVGLSILFTRNASSGGMDIVAKLIHKYLKVELGTAVSVSGILVALTSMICYDGKTVILSVLGTWCTGLLVDHFIFGIDQKYEVCILSNYPDQLISYLLHDLCSGATIKHAIGAYSKTVRQEIVAVVDKQEYRKLMEYIRKTDPKAFVTVYAISELMYQPKTRNADDDQIKKQGDSYAN